MKIVLADTIVIFRIVLVHKRVIIRIVLVPTLLGITVQTIATFICQQYPHNDLLLLTNTLLPITLIFIQQSPVLITQHYSYGVLVLITLEFILKI
jgi:hypothetical protein